MDLLEGYDCPTCKRKRLYKTKAGVDQGRYKPCRSCANSLSQGGKGWTPTCIDCGINEKYYHSLCKECHSKRSKKYHKEIYRWSKYNLNGPIDLIECEICGAVNDLCIDHDHNTNKFRGVLCRQCNSALGLLKESKEIIKKASEYAGRTF